MHHDMSTQAAAVFVCFSTLDLSTICARLQKTYHLPDFQYDDHSSWTYAQSFGQKIGFNVTKTERDDTIAQWMPGIPTPVNYQILVFLGQKGRVDTSADESTYANMKAVSTFLCDLFGTDLRRIGREYEAE